MRRIHPRWAAAWLVLVFITGVASGREQDTGGSKEKGVSKMEKPSSRLFGRLPDGTEVTIHSLRVPGGWQADVSDYGAILVRMLVPDRDGTPADVVLGFDSLDGYTGLHPYFGAICGRVSNRIAGGRFELDGKAYSLAKNNGDHHLHGGLVGFDKKVWKSKAGVSAKGPFVEFEMESPDGDEGYPGKLSAKVVYTLSPEGELVIDMEATTDAATFVNMVHHSYWNLAGHGSGPIRGHELSVAAERYLPIDAGGIPTGKPADVRGTPFDFLMDRTPPATLGKAIDLLPPSADGKNAGGVDHNFVIDGWQPDAEAKLVARLRDPTSGRTMEILSNQPGIQVYTANYLDGTLTGKEGAVYRKNAAVCLETQTFPDSVHHPEWPTQRLDPGRTYHHVMVHRFTAGR